MARLWYRPSPADYVIGVGETVSLLDEAGNPVDPPRSGRLTALPLNADSYDVYTDAALTSLTTDLLDESGTPITAVSSSTDWDTLARLQAFQGPDDHEGPLYLSADSVVGYRVEPDSGPLWERTRNLSTSDLEDWSDSARPDGAMVAWNAGTGQHEYVAGVAPTNLNDLTDVDTTGATDGQSLVRSGSSWIPGSPGSIPWNNVAGKPTTFPPSPHTHDDRYYTRAQIDDLLNNGDIDSMPSLDRFEDPLNPGTYPVARGTERADLVIHWHGTVQPPIAEPGGADFLTTGTALDGVDEFHRRDA